MGTVGVSMKVSLVTQKILNLEIILQCLILAIDIYSFLLDFWCASFLTLSCGAFMD
jgi:hypothetical protein